MSKIISLDETPVRWLSSRKLKANRQSFDDLVLEKAATRKCDMYDGLWIYPEYGRITFRFVWNKWRHGNLTLFRNRNNELLPETAVGIWPNLEAYNWFNHMVNQLLPTATRLYGI